MTPKDPRSFVNSEDFRHSGRDRQRHCETVRTTKEYGFEIYENILINSEKMSKARILTVSSWSHFGNDGFSSSIFVIYGLVFTLFSHVCDASSSSSLFSSHG